MIGTTVSVTLMRTSKHGKLFNEMEYDARHARLLITPTLSSKLPHDSKFAQDLEEQMEFGNLDN